MMTTTAKYLSIMNYFGGDMPRILTRYIVGDDLIKFINLCHDDNKMIEKCETEKQAQQNFIKMYEFFDYVPKKLATHFLLVADDELIEKFVSKILIDYPIL